MNTLDKVAITSRSFSANKYLVEELRARYANITLNNSGKTLVGSELLEFLDGQNKVIVGLENFDKNLIEIYGNVFYRNSSNKLYTDTVSYIYLMLPTNSVAYISIFPCSALNTVNYHSFHYFCC